MAPAKSRKKKVRRTLFKPAPGILRLPPELRDIIADNLFEVVDFSCLSRTCKTWHATMLPYLFEHVTLHVPQYRDGLDIIENVVVLAPMGLKYIRYLDIVPHHPRSRLESMQALSREAPRMGNKPGHRPYDESAIVCTFNMLLRLLVAKIPENVLQSFQLVRLPPTDFRFRWSYEIGIDLKTLATIIDRHRETLNDFEIYTHSQDAAVSLDEHSVAAITNLRCSTLPEAGVYDHGHWIFDIIARNSTNMQQLAVGFEDLVLQSYKEGALAAYDAAGGYTEDISTRFFKLLAESLRTATDDDDFILLVDELCLCVLDLRPLINQPTGSCIDFTSLTSLALESCPGLQEILNAWVRQCAAFERRSPLPNLRDLTVRSELSGTRMQTALQRLLGSLNGLTTLQILLEGQDTYSLDLGLILNVHGPTLRSLVWELRKESALANHRQEYAYDIAHFYKIASRCTNLQELGIGLRWHEILTSSVQRSWIARTLCRMPALEALNIRSIPPSENADSWPAIDPTHKGLATAIVELMMSGPRTPLPLPHLKYIAIGALTHRDVHMGSEPNTLNDAFRRRVYHVGYFNNFRSQLVPHLTLLAKGCVYSEHNTKDIDILRPYWLG